MRKTKLRDLFALHQVLDESSLEDCIRLVIELNVRYAWYIVNNNNNNNNNNNIYIYYIIYYIRYSCPSPTTSLTTTFLNLLTSASSMAISFCLCTAPSCNSKKYRTKDCCKYYYFYNYCCYYYYYY